MKSTIGYSGGVTARLSVHNSNGYHFKNNGTKLLWNLLAMAVTGNDFSHMIPKSIGVYERKDGKDNSLLCSPVPIYGTVWGDVVSTDQTSTSALFSATATYTDMKSLTQGGTVVLKLLTIDEKPLAEIEDVDGVLKNIHDTITPGIDAIYEWQLTFKNIEISEQSEENV